MTLECIVIPLWGSGIIGAIVCVIGVWLGKYHINTPNSSIVTAFVAVMCISFGFGIALGVIVQYAMIVISQLIPCITVIP